MTPALELQAVSAGYGPRRVLAGVSLAVKTGEIVGVIGPNGSGKTTLLRCLTRAVTPNAGQVRLEGRPLASWSPRDIARRVAVVPQSTELPAGFSVADVVALGRTPHLAWFGISRRQDRQAVRLALEQTDTIGLAARRVDELSGGERQRVVLARALAQQTAIVLLDEPTAALDVGHQAEVLHLLAQLQAECSLTIVAVFHDLTLAAQFCQRLVLLDAGRVVADGAPDAVLRTEVLAPVYGAGVRVERLASGQPVVLAAVDAYRDGLAAARAVINAARGGD